MPISIHPSIRPPPKLPNDVKDAMSSPNLGQDPNVKFEVNSPHQEGINYRNICCPRPVIPGAATGIDKVNKYFKRSAKILSTTGRYRLNP